MIRNNLKIALRTLLKFKGFASINLIGLALGITAGVLIMIYTLDELSYDQFHLKKDRIYRVCTLFRTGESDNKNAMAANGWPIGKVLEKEYPEVEAVAYFRTSGFFVDFEGKRVRQKMFYVTPEFLTMFSFPLKKGNPERALTDPYSVVISEEMEKKFFKGEDALNKTLTMADTLNFVVTGVMKNIPSNSHIQADVLISFSTYTSLNPGFNFDDGWGNINMGNYVLLKEGTDFSQFALKARDIYDSHVGEKLKQWGISASVVLEPLPEIYLKSKSGNGMGPMGSIGRVYLVSGIAAFVILLACINFINLTTARSAYRAKEVGLRKVVGSTRQGLITQFLNESLMLTLMALIIAIALMGLFLPYFNQLLGKNYGLSEIGSLPIVLGIILLVIFITLLSGYYPAFIISGLRPADVLKGKMQTGARGIQLRRALVIFQFVISGGLVMGTLVVIDQLGYMQQQSLGFNKDEILVVNMARATSPNPQGFETFKNELNTLAQVNEVTYTNSLPGNPGWLGQVCFEEGKGADESISVEYMAVDQNYITTLDLEIIAGNNFDLLHETDLKDGLILNEKAVSLFGWSSPQEAIGKVVDSPSKYPAGRVIGVVKDYHSAGLQQQIGPVAMDYAPRNSYLFAIKYKAAGTQALIQSLKNLWDKTYPGYDFNYFFLDEDFEKQYQAEMRLEKVFGLFSAITIIIAVIGLLGLVSFTAISRTKEIGIRKILGAGVLNITALLSKEYFILTLIANAIAFPLAWYFSNQWLKGFAYRMELDALIFVWTACIGIGITLASITYQTVKAATSDPVKSLRYE